MTDQAVVEYTPVSLDVLGSKRPQEVLRLKYDVAHIMDAVLKGPTKEHPAGIHYGPSFPGSKKNSLLLPGAHTLASTFGVTPRYEVTEIPDGKGRRYQIKASMYSRSGLFLGEGLGEASTEEEKFAWEAVVCDKQYDEASPLDVRIKYKRDDSEQGFYEVKQIRTSVADKSNTALKIGKKRAFVDGIILVLDCSDIFDQDFEELGDELGFERTSHAPRHPKAPKLPPAPKIPYGDYKDRQINEEAVPLAELEYLATAAHNSLQDPKKARFKVQNTLLLAALDAEIAKRKQTVPQEPAQIPPKTSPATPGQAKTEQATSTPKAITDSAWAEFVNFWETDWFDLYAVTKEWFHIQSGHDLPVGSRQDFYDQINLAITKAQAGK